ncbi:MAG: ABC transporter ATP-binding protein [Actinomycetota bacterium]
MSRQTPPRTGRVRRLLDGPFGALARRHRRRLAAQVTLSLVQGLTEAFVLVMVTRLALAAADDADVVELPIGGDVSIAWGATAAVLAIVVKLAVGVTSARVVSGMFANSLTDLRRRLVAAFFRADWDAIATERLGDLQTLVTNHAARASQALLNLSGLLLAAGRVIVILIAALIVSPIAAGLAIALGALISIAVSPFSRATKRHAERLKELMRDVSVHTTETTRLSLEARSFGVEGHLLDDLDAAYREAEESIRRGRIATMLGPQVYQNLALLLIVIGAATVASLGSTDIADHGASVLLLLRSFSYAQNAQGQYQNLLQGLPFVAELAERTAELEDRPAPDGPTRIDRIGAIELDHVAFTYPDGTDVLHDVSLTIRPGERIGVIGPSGAGKSTLIQLLLGLRRPTAGHLRIGGADMGDVASVDLRRLIAYVPQEPRLMSTSITDNVRFFRPLSEEEVRLAVERANVLDDVLRRDGGFDSSVGSGGSEVSGGQRQRLTIARALAGRPDVLILDEPTSSLDDDSDRAVRTGIDALQDDVTVIVITHRASTLEMCDRVLVLDGDGSVREQQPALDAPGEARP